jgi:NADH-quinone oxidoreductase subunit G
MVSELSGNVIDVCPVGALTNKPFRFSARTWEMTQHPGIAAHDGLGSNLDFHVKQDQVKRIVPGHNNTVNEVWLSDRDRYSYEGLYSQQRLTVPMVKQNGNWQELDWQLAFDTAAERLKFITASHPEQLGALVSPQATTEEALLLQKLVRGLGSHNIDHRLHQGDFSDQQNDHLFPWLGQGVVDLEALDSALIIAGNPRRQQPLLNLRLRKASLQGASIMFLNPVDYDINYDVAEKLIAVPMQLAYELAAILKSAITVSGKTVDTGKLLESIQVSDTHKRIAEDLCNGTNTAILAGNLFTAHPAYSTLRYLAVLLASVTEASFGYLGESANDAGLYLTGTLPHRGPAGEAISNPGLNTISMLEARLNAYLLFNIDPAMDIWDSSLAMNALQEADTVIAFTAFKSNSLLDVADILLPISIYAENDGTYFNVSGTSQSFSSCVPSQGESKPGWKVLRVLADGLGIPDTDYENISEIQDELSILLTGTRPDNTNAGSRPDAIPSANGSISRFSELPMNSVDNLVRNAAALQQTPDVADGLVHLSSELAARLGLSDGDRLSLEQGGETVQLGYVIDDRIPDKAVLIYAAHPDVATLGPWFGDIRVQKG